MALRRRGRRTYALVAFAVLAAVLWYTLAPPARAALWVGNVRYMPSSYDWGKATPFHPVAADDVKALPSGEPKSFPRIQAQPRARGGDDATARHRKEAVRRAFVKSWEAYKAYAWGKDELMPLSKRGKQTFSGWSAQLVDALDTLWIMGLEQDFRRAVDEVARINWSRTHLGRRVNVFEVTIRYLGGLLAAYDLSHEPVLLAKAVELGDTLYAAFDTPNRLPTHWLKFRQAKRGRQMADERMSSAAGGSLSLEFTRLSQITGDAKYYDATERVKLFFHRLQNHTKLPGLWPIAPNYRDETMDGGYFTLGAGADSMYEYLAKMHQLLGGRDPQYEAMAATALDAARQQLLFRPLAPRDDILMAGSRFWVDGTAYPSSHTQHLACFAGGAYGLAGRLLGNARFVDVGARLTAGCVWAYDAFPANIMPESAELRVCGSLETPCHMAEDDGILAQDAAGRDLPRGFTKVDDPRYMLRPEAIESVFYMWRITGEHKWRDAAWRMWQGIVRETETAVAFASIEDVNVRQSRKMDSMETFWLSETIKYFYLIFDDEDVISLDDWVFNTEAHPFRLRARD